MIKERTTLLCVIKGSDEFIDSVYAFIDKEHKKDASNHLDRFEVYDNRTHYANIDIKQKVKR